MKSKLYALLDDNKYSWPHLIFFSLRGKMCMAIKGYGKRYIHCMYREQQVTLPKTHEDG